MGTQLRHVASVACDTLKDLAAKQWNVDAARLVPAAGKITDPQTKRSITYGELAQGQAFETAILGKDPLIAPRSGLLPASHSEKWTAAIL